MRAFGHAFAPHFLSQLNLTQQQLCTDDEMMRP